MSLLLWTVTLRGYLISIAMSLFSFLQGLFVLKLTGIANFVNANPCKAFSLSFLILCRQVTYILMMCMKKFHAEKYFETVLQGFKTCQLLAGHALNDA